MSGVGGVQSNWNRFFERFAADVGGEPWDDYPTFRDGVTACEVMDAVRSRSKHDADLNLKHAGHDQR